MSREAPYELVLMDCQMPELDGYEATIAIRQNKAGSGNANIIIIAMTANAMKGDKEKCLTTGMNDYISKPIDPERLEQKLNYWILNSGGRQPHTINHKKEEPCFPVWDSKAALKRLRNKESMLLKIIELFLKEGADRLLKLDKAVKEKDIDSIQQYAHSLKGSAANINAEQLSRCMSEIEQQCKTGGLKNIEKINQLSDNTETCWSNLKAEISRRYPSGK